MNAVTAFRPAINLPLVYAAFVACKRARDEADRLAMGLIGIGRDVAALGDEMCLAEEAMEEKRAAIRDALVAMSGLTAEQIAEVVS